MLHSACDLSLSLYSVSLTCSLSLSPPPLLHLHIPAVCLSALSQWWCETWRQGAWAASFCQLTLWPPAPPPQLRVPMPQQATTGHLYWVDSLCQEKSFFHVAWTSLNSNAYCYGGGEHNLFLTKERAPTSDLEDFNFYCNPGFLWHFYSCYCIIQQYIIFFHITVKI